MMKKRKSKGLKDKVCTGAGNGCRHVTPTRGQSRGRGRVRGRHGRGGGGGGNA